ncbi:MAG: ATP-binding protein, partial [Chloroflexota bacterium]|nr:ATP-binding protein [Chloroflexota bacterium]
LFTIGSLIASAIERAQLYAEIERYSRELEDRVRQRTEELARATAEAESARRAAEERQQQFETIFRHTPVAMITLELDRFTVASWNPAAERLFGYTAAEARGRNIDDLVSNAELRAEAEEINRRAAEEGAFTVVTRRAHRDGHLVDVEIQVVAVKAGGRSTGAVVIYHDVTELLQARRAAEAARSLAEAANESKSRFLSNVSHELRTPLTSVLGFAKIIGKRLDEVILPAVDTSDPKRERAVRQVRDNLGIIVTEGERLTAMINNVLDLAKIESGRLEWKDEEVSIGQLVEHAANATASLFAAKGLELRTDVADDLPTVRGDPDRLLQVVINLLSNAVKFTDDGFVAVKAVRHDGEIRVAVADTGSGIAPEDYDTVFEQFRQVGDTLTDKPRGTGLGLPISKEIVEHHGGRLWLESEPGKGSTFSFSLPFGRTVAQPTTAVAPAGGEVRESMPAAADGSPLVLVADDDASTRELLRQELESRDYRVLEATDGRSALRLARGSMPDLVVLDVVMPEPDGFDVAASLKSDPATGHIPILMLTVLDAAERAVLTGVDAYVKKPFDADRLMADVARLCPPPDGGG